jgi:hypothetical protein
MCPIIGAIDVVYFNVLLMLTLDDLSLTTFFICDKRSMRHKKGINVFSSFTKKYFNNLKQPWKWPERYVKYMQ